MILGNVIYGYRISNRIGVREMAKTIGMSHATLSRIERGYPCDGATLAKILTWLMSEPLRGKEEK